MSISVKHFGMVRKEGKIHLLRMIDKKWRCYCCKSLTITKMMGNEEPKENFCIWCKKHLDIEIAKEMGLPYTKVSRRTKQKVRKKKRKREEKKESEDASMKESDVPKEEGQYDSKVGRLPPIFGRGLEELTLHSLKKHKVDYSLLLVDPPVPDPEDMGIGYKPSLDELLENTTFDDSETSYDLSPPPYDSPVCDDFSTKRFTDSPNHIFDEEWVNRVLKTI